MHVVYSCYFANLNLLLFSVSVVAVVVNSKSSLILLQSAALRRGGAL